MEFFKWDEKYSVGVEEIDLQHQKLFDIINQMLGYMGKATKEELRTQLNEMIDYTSFHFQAEQKYLEKHPNFQAHLEEHNIFLKKNDSISKSIEETDQDVSLEIVNFLLKWLKNHILKTDVLFFAEIH